MVVQVNRLNHLQAADRDEAVQRDAHAAHDAGGDGVDEADEGIKEAQQHTVDRGDSDGADGGVARDGDAADGLAVGGVGAAAKQRAHDGARAVAQQGAVQAGIGNQVMADDGGEVLVVGNMLGQGHEGHGGEENEQAQHVARAADGVGSVLISAEHAQEGEARHLEQLHVIEGGELDQLQRFAAGGTADEGQDQGDHIRAQDTDDEGHHLHALRALYGGEHGDEEGDQTYQDGHQVVAAGGGVVQVVHRAAAQAQADQGDGGADDHRRQELGHPGGAGLFNDQGDEHIHKASEQGANEDAQEAIRAGAGQGADEGEGAAQEHGALLAGGDEDVEQRAHACAKQRGRLVQVQAGAVRQHGHQQGGGHDGQQLLEGVDKVLLEGRLLIDVIDQFHWGSLHAVRSTLRAFCRKKALPGQGKAIKHSFSAMCCSLPGLSGPRLKDTHSVVGVSLPRSAALVKGKKRHFSYSAQDYPDPAVCGSLYTIKLTKRSRVRL